MNKPWFAQYDEWAPQEGDPGTHKNVVEMLLQAGERFADKVAYSNFGVTRTYAETLVSSRNFAAYLQTELGLKKGDRVVVSFGSPLWKPGTKTNSLRIAEA